MVHLPMCMCVYIYIEREYNKVQTCLGLETFTANLRTFWGFFKACPVGLTDSYKMQFGIYIYC